MNKKTKHRFRQTGPNDYEYRACRLKHHRFNGRTRRWEVWASGFHAHFASRKKAKAGIDNLINNLLEHLLTEEER